MNAYIHIVFTRRDCQRAIYCSENASPSARVFTHTHTRTIRRARRLLFYLNANFSYSERAFSDPNDRLHTFGYRFISPSRSGPKDPSTFVRDSIYKKKRLPILYTLCHTHTSYALKRFSCSHLSFARLK